MINAKEHHYLNEANNCLRMADKMGVGIFACEASEFAPASERKEDTVIVVLRGRKARRGRKALTELADLIANSAGR